MLTNTISIVAGISKLKLHIAALDPALLRKLVPQGALLGLNYILIYVATPQDANPPHAVGHLSARTQRPRCHRAAHCCYELAPSHSEPNEAMTGVRRLPKKLTIPEREI